MLDDEPFGQRIGVYVMGISRKGGSAVPWYVGKTEKNSLGYESLHRDKIRKYAQALISSGEGTPILYFVTSNSGWDEKRIDRLETFLIWLARQRNPSLLNAKKVHLTPSSLNGYLAELQIHGILNSTQGYPGDSISFRSMIGWSRTMHLQLG
ncbi:MAG TPA: hypothetical protein VE826_11865 [Dongiaceae bacterium]|nr:hypothetical protein [Dongiaceae bacterium]